MDSEQRHDLKENDLAEFLSNFGQWWNKWGNWILSAFVVFAVLFLVYRFWSNSVTTAHEDAWTDLAIENSPAGFAAIADAYSDPTVKVLAYLRGGDAALAETVTPDALEAEATGQTDADAEINAKLDQAAAMYQQVLDATQKPVYRLNALMGLGAVAEMREDWDDARQRYESVAEAAGDRWPAFADQARVRLEMLPQLARPIAFAPEPEPQPAATEPMLDFDLPEVEPLNLETPTFDLSSPAPIVPASPVLPALPEDPESPDSP